MVEKAAVIAYENFVARFQKHQLPTDIPEKSLTYQKNIAIGVLLKEAELVSSTSDARRLIQQGAVKIDGQKIDVFILQFQQAQNTFIK